MKIVVVDDEPTIVLKPFTPTELAQGVAAAVGGSPPAPDARSA